MLWRRHCITEGEWLFAIAGNYGATVSDIARVNGLTVESVFAEAISLG